MGSAREIAKDVWTFLDAACEKYGAIQAERFSQNMHAEMVETLQSPIEDLFYVACHVMCLAAFVDVNPDPEFNNTGIPVLGHGVYIQPQFKIGKYRVDFLLSQNGVAPAETYTPVVVELDGHDFHDKDKRQRSYEKERDRFLVRSGFRVLHFTGSDVVADPYRCAHECLSMVGALVGAGMDEYNKDDPLRGY